MPEIIVPTVDGGQQVSAVLLAAGESRRMGEANKLALPINGEPLLRHSVRTLLQSRLRELVVVLGHRAEEAGEMLAGLPVRSVHNPHYAEGQMTSVHCGLAALREPCAGVMVCLCDQPLLTTTDINGLIGAFLHRRSGSIVVPVFQGRRGNPIVFSHAQRDAILADGRNLGCKKLIERHPEWVEKIAMDDDRWVFDLDTPEDYQRLQQRLAASDG